MGNFEQSGFGYGSGDDYGDGWGDASPADLEGFVPAVDPMYDSGIIRYNELEESKYTPPASLRRPTERTVDPRAKKESAQQTARPVRQPQARPPLPNHTGDKPLTTSRSTKMAGAAVATVVAIAGIGHGVEAWGEGPGIRSEIESDFRGTNFLGQDTDNGCLDGTPYGATEIHVDGVLSPGQTNVTIGSADPELPDLKFDSYGKGSGRVVDPVDDYTDTFLRYHDCEGSYSGD
jgi:hypothetical protein